MDEKRRDIRIPEENTIILNVLPEGDEAGVKEVFELPTRDISAGGMRVVAKGSFPPDREVNLEFVLSHSQRVIKGRGRIRWSAQSQEEDQFEVGIEFIKLKPEDLAALLDHIYNRPVF
ncbi:MAG: PilZ domain-containing protein [Candidatus Aminicenantes bacterium]|nr:PilZ domain-containing protein [Candidatus Aminicenantes bacterium]